jgi:uncharacterized membrane-anchored protein YitT (DUF2179 family)
LLNLFIANVIVDHGLSGIKNGYKFEIVTSHPDELAEELMSRLKHGVTEINVHGMYSGDDNYIIFSVMNVKDIPHLMDILKNHPETFAYFSDGVRVQGDFHFKEEEIGKWISAFK